MKLKVQAIEAAVADVGYSYKQLAEAAGVSCATLSNINSGKPCRPVIAGKLAKALNVPLERLIETREG